MAEFIRGDHHIHYELAGAHEFRLITPVLMLHGNGENMHCFDEVIAQLSNSKAFVLMDSRLQGESYCDNDADAQLSYSLMADDAIALMQYLNISEYDVVGYSDGGIVALLMAMRTLNVRRVVTIGANTDPDGLSPRAVREIRAMLKKASLEGDYRTERLMRLMLEEPHITLRELSGIIAETTIILGKKDPIITKKHSQHIADAIPRGSHMFIEGAGHDIPATHAGVLSDTLRTLL